MDDRLRCSTAETENQATELTSNSIPWLCNLVLVLAAVVQLSRILQVESATGEVPFLSANDRSRWCTIAALAVDGTYEIDEVLEIRDPVTRRRTWYSIDLVRHRGPDGEQHYYSSKPPFLPTLYAGVYFAVRSLTGATLMNDPFFVARLMLIIVNLVPLLIFWWLLMYWLRGEGLGVWATIVTGVFVCWGTYLSTFLPTLNNHLPAAIAVGLSLGCLDRIVLKRDRRLGWFVLCGLSISFGAANELPALSWMAASVAVLLIVAPRQTLVATLPAMLPVGLMFFATNYWAHGELIPAYAHRDVGERLFEFPIDAPLSIEKLSPEIVAEQLQSQAIRVSQQTTIRPARRAGVFEFWDAENELRFALRRDGQTAAGQQIIGVYEWGDWYDYPGSYWTSERKQGVDKGEPNRGVYIFHSLVGHHGIFSLTPFWFVTVCGVWVIWRGRETVNFFVDHRLLIAAAITATSLVSIAFYLARPLEDRNYGGVSSGFRWSFWLTPLWIWLAIPALRAVHSRLGRRLVEVLMLASVFSASFAWQNPWTSPWIMQYWEYLGW